MENSQVIICTKILERYVLLSQNGFWVMALQDVTSFAEQGNIYTYRNCNCLTSRQKVLQSRQKDWLEKSVMKKPVSCNLRKKFRAPCFLLPN